MRVPIYRVVNDDNPLDYDYPLAVSLPSLYANGDPTGDVACALRVGETITIGGGAAVQFTLTRIR